MLSEGSIKGVCLKECATNADCGTNYDCFADGQCVLSTQTGEQYCGYMCAENADCPTNMVCDKSLGLGLCAAPGCEIDPSKEHCEDECPLNSGYPCACDVTTCEDGTQCASLSAESFYGVCLKDCTGGKSCDIAGFGCDAVPTCALSTGTGDQFCALLCCQDEDCPQGMDCDDSLGIGVCAKTTNVDPNMDHCEDECPINSGYPCGCNEETCADETVCAGFGDGSAYGLCMKTCEGNDDCATELSCEAQAKCALTNADQTEQYCALTCIIDQHCPAGMVCDDSLGAGICLVGDVEEEDTATQAEDTDTTQR
jgi:hypothetical protein